MTDQAEIITEVRLSLRGIEGELKLLVGRLDSMSGQLDSLEKNKASTQIQQDHETRIRNLEAANAKRTTEISNTNIKVGAIIGISIAVIQLGFPYIIKLLIK